MGEGWLLPTLTREGLPFEMVAVAKTLPLPVCIVTVKGVSEGVDKYT